MDTLWESVPIRQRRTVTNKLCVDVLVYQQLYISFSITQPHCFHYYKVPPVTFIVSDKIIWTYNLIRSVSVK